MSPSQYLWLATVCLIGSTQSALYAEETLDCLRAGVSSLRYADHGPDVCLEENAAARPASFLKDLSEFSVIRTRTTAILAQLGAQGSIEGVHLRVNPNPLGSLVSYVDMETDENGENERIVLSIGRFPDFSLEPGVTTHELGHWIGFSSQNLAKIHANVFLSEALADSLALLTTSRLDALTSEFSCASVRSFSAQESYRNPLVQFGASRFRFDHFNQCCRHAGEPRIPEARGICSEWQDTRLESDGRNFSDLPPEELTEAIYGEGRSSQIDIHYLGTPLVAFLIQAEGAEALKKFARLGYSETSAPDLLEPVRCQVRSPDGQTIFASEQTRLSLTRFLDALLQKVDPERRALLSRQFGIDVLEHFALSLANAQAEQETQGQAIEWAFTTPAGRPWRPICMGGGGPYWSGRCTIHCARVE